MRARRIASAGLYAGVVLALQLASWSTGCASETRHRVLSTVFDGVPPPGEARPPRRRPRASTRPMKPVVEVPNETQTAEMLRQAVVEPVRPSFASFEALRAALPSDAMGNVDWAAAAREGQVRPRPGIEPDSADIPTMPLDVKLDPGIPGFEVVFPHEAHTFWLRCDNCHPAIFQMRAGTAPITMTAIFTGEYCGRCHGKVAFAPETGCPRCHVRLGAGS